MKRIVSLFMTFLLVLSAVQCLSVVSFAAEENHGSVVNSGNCGEKDEDGNFISNVTYTFYKDGTIVISGTGPMADFTICSDDGGDEVSDAPWADFTIQNVIIKDGVTNIGDYAFYKCYDISNVNLGNSVERIGKYAITGCDCVSSLVLPESLKRLEEYALYGLWSVENITIPQNVEYIGGGALSGGYYLKSISVDKNNKYYCSDKNGVLYNIDKSMIVQYPANAAKSTYTVAKGVERIGQSSFAYAQIKNLKLYADVEKIDEKAFYYSSMKSITIPKSLKYIMKDAFFWCQNLSDVYYFGSQSDWNRIKSTTIDHTINVGVADYYPTMHYNYSSCLHNNKIVLENQEATCSQKGFTDCIRCNDCGEYLSGNVVDAKEHVFYNDSLTCSVCSEKRSIVADGNCGKYGDNVRFTVYSDGEIIISGEDEMTSYDYDLSPWSDYEIKKVTVNNGITSIGENDFSNCYTIEKISFPDTLETIQDWAFYDCSFLSDISLPNSVSYIGEIAFANCSLKKLSLPASLTDMDSRAFEGNNIETVSVDINNPSYCTVDNVLFNKDKTKLIMYPNASNRKTYNVPSEVKTISSNAFICCNYLEKIVVSESVERIGEYVFAWSKNLKSIVLPKSLKSISYMSFYGCDSLKDIYYTGSCGQWKKIEIDSELDGIKIHFQTPHNYQAKTTPATTAKDGQKVTACTICGDVYKKSVIYKVSSIKLSANSYTYDGKVKTPSVTVKDSKGKTLTNGTDYTVTYASGRKNPGQYAVKVTLKGNYSGSKMLYFTILPGVTSKIATATDSSAIKLAWKAVPGATGYRVYYYNPSTKKYTALKTTTATSYTITKLKIGTNYKFAVKAYTTVNGKTYWSAGYKTVTATALPGVTSKIATATNSSAIKLAWKAVPGATGYRVYYYNPSTKKYTALKTTTATSYTVTKLNTGSSYTFAVRAYTTVNGKTYWSAGYKTATSTALPGRKS